MKLPNPGYPAPRGVRIVLRSGTVLEATVTWDELVFDAGVPSPRFLLTVPGMELGEFRIERIEADYMPPGTLIAFNQVGDPRENADRIRTQSVRHDKAKITMRRDEQ